MEKVEDKAYFKRYSSRLKKLTYDEFIKWVEIYTIECFEEIKDGAYERMKRGDEKFSQSSYNKNDYEITVEAKQELQDFINYNLILKDLKKL